MPLDYIRETRNRDPRAALEAGGKVHSVILGTFLEMGLGLEGVTELEVVDDLRPRKARMEANTLHSTRQSRASCSLRADFHKN